mgnify:CR=1 FL=1
MLLLLAWYTLCCPNLCDIRVCFFNLPWSKLKHLVYLNGAPRHHGQLTKVRSTITKKRCHLLKPKHMKKGKACGTLISAQRAQKLSKCMWNTMQTKEKIMHWNILCQKINHMKSDKEYAMKEDMENKMEKEWKLKNWNAILKNERQNSSMSFEIKLRMPGK